MVNIFILIYNFACYNIFLRVNNLIRVNNIWRDGKVYILSSQYICVQEIGMWASRLGGEEPFSQRASVSSPQENQLGQKEQRTKRWRKAEISFSFPPGAGQHPSAASGPWNNRISSLWTLGLASVVPPGSQAFSLSLRTCHPLLPFEDLDWAVLLTS